MELEPKDVICYRCARYKIVAMRFEVMIKKGAPPLRLALEQVQPLFETLMKEIEASERTKRPMRIAYEGNPKGIELSADDAKRFVHEAARDFKDLLEPMLSEKRRAAGYSPRSERAVVVRGEDGGLEGLHKLLERPEGGRNL